MLLLTQPHLMVHPLYMAFLLFSLRLVQLLQLGRLLTWIHRPAQSQTRLLHTTSYSSGGASSPSSSSLIPPEYLPLPSENSTLRRSQHPHYPSPKLRGYVCSTMKNMIPLTVSTSSPQLIFRLRYIFLPFLALRF